MKKKKDTLNTLIPKLMVTLLLQFALFFSPAMALQQGHLKVTSKAQKLIVKNKGGQKIVQFIPAKKVLPGEIIQYTTFFENISNKPAENINIVNPIPKHTVYLAHTAQGKNTNITYSVDGGKHYGKAATLKIKGKNGKWHLAKPSEYTHIRWQYKSKLAPKTKQAVSFRVRLR